MKEESEDAGEVVRIDMPIVDAEGTEIARSFSYRTVISYSI